MYWCIYRITNKINGKTYIGQHHYTNEKNPMGRYWGGGILLHRAIEKYGKENFEREVIYRRIRDKETVDAMEIWAIAKERKENKNGCYNIANGGGGLSHIDYPEELRRKLSEAAKGNQKWLGKHHSDETKRKISEAKKGNQYWLGRHHSEETKRKIGEQKKGNKNNLGKHWSDETKQKTVKHIREKHLGIKKKV